MHLLVPLLQVLLTCLFTLHKTSRPAISQQPPIWLQSRNHGLEASHAVACSRVLLTFTEPTVSSTSTRSRFSNNAVLTDENRKSRQYAAKFVPYVLSHFCSLHLFGRMSPEVRKAILPGIWACIGAMPREGLKGMNALLSRDERAIWASLWSEWSTTHGRPA